MHFYLVTIQTSNLILDDKRAYQSPLPSLQLSSRCPNMSRALRRPEHDLESTGYAHGILFWPLENGPLENRLQFPNNLNINTANAYSDYFDLKYKEGIDGVLLYLKVSHLNATTSRCSLSNRYSRNCSTLNLRVVSMKAYSHTRWFVALHLAQSSRLISEMPALHGRWSE
jgi:hypothetical protein